MLGRRSAAFRYTLLGMLVGFGMPILSTLLDLFWQELPLSLGSIMQVQSSSPSQWVVDTAPLVLSLVAHFVGRREDRLSQARELLDLQVQQLESLQGTLEQSVAERTHDLEQRAVQLATAADVGRAVTSILDLEVLTRRVVDLVRERFALYYTGLFLVDDATRYAVLEAGTGEAGRVMKQEGHRLEVGSLSMVGMACALRQARIALDVGEERVRFDNPLLPHTRSEMALPLMVGDRVLGALDVQSTEPTAFSDTDVTILQLVADQVAVAVENARKISEEAGMLEATSPIFRLSRQMASAGTTDEIVQVILDSIAETEADGCAVARYDHATGLPGETETLAFVGSWDRSGESRFPIGIPMPAGASRFPLSMAARFWTVDDISGDTRLPDDTRQFLLQLGHRALANIPLRAGDQLSGFAIVYRASPGPFSAVTVRLYETIIDQAAVALERTLLLEDAQQRAARERTVSKVTGRMRQTLDVESVLKTAVEEIGDALGLAALDLRLDIRSAADNAMPAEERV